MPVEPFEVTRRAPYADGVSFGDVGPFEQIEASVTFAVDPANDANAGIVDLELAPRDASGRVRFRYDFSLIRPVEAGQGNGRVLIELPNRGRKLYGTFNRASRLEGPATSDAPGDGFLFRRGWSVASIGWQWDVVPDGRLLAFDAPPVLIDGKPITGQNVVTIRPNGRQRSFLLANRSHLVYQPCRLDDPEAVLYVRDHENGADTMLPREAWSFAKEQADGSVVPSAEHVYLESRFEGGKTYNLVYEATGARVVGAGLLAYRDIASFLRGTSPLNPMPGGYAETYGFGVSQTGRVQRQFLYQGLNLDEEGRQAFDGMLLHVAGGRRGEFNHRFAQPSVSMTPGFGNRFPFSDDDAVDPFSGVTDGMLRRQRQRGGVPKLIYTNTSAEYWRGDAALLHVDATGQHDLPDAPETRIYHFAGTQHTAGALPQRDVNPNEGTRGGYGFNLVDYVPLLRAALINLESWVADGTEPPPSAHSRLDDGTLVPPATTLAAIGRVPGATTPEIEGCAQPAGARPGAEADEGIGRYPAKLGRAYPRLVPAVDADGNERAGVRLPDITVPVATHTGWNTRHPDMGSPELLISMMGTTRFFPATAADRTHTGDPRLSIEERYESKAAYIDLVRDAARSLAGQHLILEGDIELVVSSAVERYDAAVGAAAVAAK